MNAETYYVALYNCDKKELMAVMPSPTISAKFLFEHQRPKDAQRVSTAFNRGNRINNTRFDFPVAVRRPSEAHLALAKEKGYWIKEGYPVPNCKLEKMY